MKISKTVWYLILLALIVIVAIVLNEFGLGLISLLLLFPAYLLFERIWGDDKPSTYSTDEEKA
jgi:hypothetical protein